MHRGSLLVCFSAGMVWYLATQQNTTKHNTTQHNTTQLLLRCTATHYHQLLLLVVRLVLFRRFPNFGWDMKHRGRESRAREDGKDAVIFGVVVNQISMHDTD